MKFKAFFKVIGAVSCLTAAALVVRAQLNMNDRAPTAFAPPAGVTNRSGITSFLDSIAGGAASPLVFDRSYALQFESTDEFQLAAVSRAASVPPSAAGGAIDFDELGADGFSLLGAETNAGVWADESGPEFENAITGSAGRVSFKPGDFFPEFPPATYAMSGLLALACLIAVHRIQHQSVALAG